LRKLSRRSLGAWGHFASFYFGWCPFLEDAIHLPGIWIMV
jgi:hypothetical protein